eukprot:4236456-Pyramimonas_sp.AAC.3
MKIRGLGGGLGAETTAALGQRQPGPRKSATGGPVWHGVGPPRGLSGGPVWRGVGPMGASPGGPVWHGVRPREVPFGMVSGPENPPREDPIGMVTADDGDDDDASREHWCEVMHTCKGGMTRCTC